MKTATTKTPATPAPTTAGSDTTDVPYPSYPRPDRDRSARWQSLDGAWDFTWAEGQATITVPFAWETPASGIGRTWLEQGTYRRAVTVPTDWSGTRTVLCFGGVHHHARILIDGALVAEHTGGYISFEVDVTEHVAPGTTAELTVEVHAPADKRAIAHGKQRSIPRDDYDGVCFTPTSGIWQSVWLEARGRTYADQVTLCGDSRTGIDVTVQLAGDAPSGTGVAVTVLGTGESLRLVTDAVGHAQGRIEIECPREWSPQDPHLYRVQVVTDPDGAAADRVVLTTGLRTIETRGEHLFLNGERIAVRGVLDQGYWPSSGLTAPDEAALLRDLDLARELGYTLVRKHLKLEDPRWLHHADELGMLIWAEPACPSRYSAEAVSAFEAQIEPMVIRDGNHPSIVIWGLYNEEWGLDWDIPGSTDRAAAAERAYDLLAALDRSRPIVENSGWAHVKTDLVDWHYYEPDPGAWADAMAAFATGARDNFPVRLGPDFVVDKSFYASADVPRDLPILNSEYGEGFTSLERAWHLRWQTQEMRRHDRFSGYVYTELTDVEHEMAGLLDAWRNPKDWGGLCPADVNADTVLIVDLVPLRAGADIEVPTADLTLGVRVSQHGSAPVTGRVCAAWAPAGRPTRVPDGSGPESGLGAHGSIDAQAVERTVPVTAVPFVVTDAVSVTVLPPGGPARLLLWLEDTSGLEVARTFVDAAEVEELNRRGARAG